MLLINYTSLDDNKILYGGNAGLATATLTKGNINDSMLYIDYADLNTDVYQETPGSTTYEGIYVTCDDEPLTQNEDYSLEQGSIKVTLKKDYLDDLDAETHTLKVYISTSGEASETLNDFVVSASVVIEAGNPPIPAPETPEPEPTPETPSRPIYKAPNTGVR